ncbi:MAG: type II toxin-antitoxin system YafQ family toxin [Clostridium sp.]|nr:type II toxin-antitoxin system YafQ family toxin [Clostridium sp.]
MLKIVPSNQFKKDLKLARRRGCKIERLRDVVNVLANGQKLDEKHHDHGLACCIMAIFMIIGFRGTQGF